jgi:hypothetical protein
MIPCTARTHDEASSLLPHHDATVRDQRGVHRRIPTGLPALGSVRRNVVASRVLAVVLGSVGLVAWVGVSSSSSGWSKLMHQSGASVTASASQQQAVADGWPTAAAADALLYRWEEFLYGHVADGLLTADVSRVMKSESKKELHSQKKLDKKDVKMKGKTAAAAAKNIAANDGDAAAGGGLVYLNTSKAFRLLRHDEEGLSDDFFYYQDGWEVQINQAYCAVATSAAVLNSYRNAIILPQDPDYDPFPFATQRALVRDECVQLAVVDVDVVQRCGLGIKMVPGMLNCFLEPQGYRAVAHPMDPSVMTVDKMRALVRAALLDSRARVVLNYDRGGLGQGPFGHGHWSPVGAYSPETDSFLVMDVAKYKYPPVFVPAGTLFGGAATLDNCASMMPVGPIDWTSGDFDLVIRQLGCEPGYRGFIVIKPID